MSWPTRDGDLQARRFCPAPGPTRGSVAARWVPPSKDNIECVVIHADGRVAVGMGKAVHVLAPDLRPIESHEFEGYVRDVVAVPSGFLVVERHDVRGICGASFPEGLTAQVTRYPFGTRLLPDGGVLVWEGTDFARVDVAAKKILARYRTTSEMSSTRHVAVAPDGTIWSAMAMSWSSPDDPTEYYATVAAFLADGRKLQEWNQNDGMPTSTGFEVQILATDARGIVSESGTLVLDPRSRGRVPRFLAMSRVALRADDMLYGVADSHAIQRTPLAGTALEPVFRTRNDDYIRKLALDGAEHVYAATTSGVFGVDERGAEMFRVEPFDAATVLLGEGYLLAAGMQRGAGLIRVH